MCYVHTYEWMDGTSLRAVLPSLILECERPKKEKMQRLENIHCGLQSLIDVVPKN
jgi:hypothetical protein